MREGTSGRDRMTFGSRHRRPVTAPGRDQRAAEARSQDRRLPGDGHRVGAAVSPGRPARRGPTLSASGGPDCGSTQVRVVGLVVHDPVVAVDRRRPSVTSAIVQLDGCAVSMKQSSHGPGRRRRRARRSGSRRRRAGTSRSGSNVEPVRLAEPRMPADAGRASAVAGLPPPAAARAWSSCSSNAAGPVPPNGQPVAEVDRSSAVGIVGTSMAAGEHGAVDRVRRQVRASSW